MKKGFLKFLLTYILISSCSFALVEEKINLSDAIKTALNTNPQIKIRKLEVLQAENEIKTVSSLQNPSFGVFQNIGPSAKGNPQQIGLDYTIELLKRGKRKKSAQFNLKSLSANEKFLEHKLIYEVKASYINFLLKKSNLKFIVEQKAISKEILDMTKKAYEKNQLQKTDYIQAKINYNRIVMYENIIKSELIYAQNRFNSIMNSNNIDYTTYEDGLNDNYGSLLTINPEKQYYNFETIKNYALNNRQDLISLSQEVEAKRNNLKVIKSKLIPDVEVSGGYAYLTKGISDSGSFRQGAYASVNLVNIPIVYKYEPEIKNAEYEIEKTQLKYEDLKIDITRDITDAWEKYTISRNNLNFYDKELLQNSKELMVESKKNLDSKKISLTDYLVVKKLYLDLMLGYQEALGEYYLSFAELLKELNIVDYKEIELI